MSPRTRIRFRRVKDASVADAPKREKKQKPSSVRCERCGTKNLVDDQFCTSCGAELGAPKALAKVAGKTEQSAEAIASKPPRFRLKARARSTASWLRKHATAIAASLLAFASIAVLASFLVIERQHSSKVTNQRSAARSQLVSVKAKLVSAERLSEKRRAVLIQAKEVLGRVDPLLSSIDGLQQSVSEIRADRDQFTSDVETLYSSLADLANSLLDANNNGYYLDASYLNSTIDSINYELQTVSDDSDTLNSSDSSYSSASDRFGNRADAFSASVRRLQRQLRAVTAERSSGRLSPVPVLSGAASPARSLLPVLR